MQDFPSNSHKAKATDAAPREKLDPVTSAETRERKQGLGRKFKTTFFAGSGRDALGYMTEDIVVPSIRDLLYNALSGGLERIFYGDRTVRPRNTSSIVSHAPGSHVAYDRQYKSQPASAPARTISRQSKARHDFQDLVIPTLSAANEVLDRLFDILSRDGEVTVAHLYELTGIRVDHTDMKIGWTNLRGSKAVRLRDGSYLLALPEPEALR